MTVDEIIARRAPERSAKSIKRAARAAEAALEEGETNDLENDMMEAMGSDIENGNDKEPSFDDEDEDSEEGDDESESGSEGASEEEEEEESDKDSGFGDEDAEDWLRLGEVSEGEGDVTKEEKEEEDGMEGKLFLWMFPRITVILINIPFPCLQLLQVLQL